jgi:hypothetical protein
LTPNVVNYLDVSTRMWMQVREEGGKRFTLKTVANAWQKTCSCELSWISLEGRFAI